MADYDYIIVGAGSAGCVLANRLSKDASNRVLLLEAGGSDQHLYIKMPSALSYPMNMPKFNWGFRSQAEPGLAGRRLDCPRGKVLGGSSSINGMVWVRGHAHDFDQWQELGAQGWGYSDCVPYFIRAETWQGGADQFRGDAGPIGVTGGSNMSNPLHNAFIKSGQQAGYTRSDDYNGAQQEGFAAMQMSVRDGIRDSTARAYLDPVMKRPNLRVVSNALAQKIVFDGKRATGVEYTQGGKMQSVYANKEIILCAGAIGSPSLLQHSGVGPKQVLKDAGVELRHILDGVGENLQDHLEVYFQYYCKKPITLNSKLGLFSKALIGARWLFFRSGLGSTNHFESCAFIRSRAGQQWPDIQYHFLPAAMRYDGTAAIKGHGFQVHVGPNKPSSRGRVRITSNNPLDKPEILFNYLSCQKDVEDWRQCIRLTREIIGQPAMDDFRGDEIQPGCAIRSDEEIDEWVRNNVESAYHPSCTCKMGAADDDMAVVDNACKVRGLESLRIVDSSIFPSITNGNLNAPTIMVAEKAADIILGNSTLTATDVIPWIDAAWQDSQRQRAPLRALSPIEDVHQET